MISPRLRRTLAALGGALAAWSASAQDTQPAPRPDSQPAQTQPTSRESDSQPARGGRSGRGGRRGERGGASSGPATSSTTTTSTATSTASSSTSTSQAVVKKDRFLTVVGGRVHTVTGPVLEAATVLCKNGKIISIGKESILPQECEIIDAAGGDVYPGLIACTSVGVLAPSNLADTSDVFGLSLNFAVAAGITSALSGNEVGKLSYGSVEDMLLSRNVFYTLAYTARNPAEKRKLRLELDRVRGYLRDLEAHEIEKQTNKDAKPPDKEFLKGRYEELRKLLIGETVAVAAANAADELLDLVDLVENYGFKLVVRGAYEGWTVAEHLGRADIDVILTPRTRVEPDPAANRPTGSTIENAALLHKAGVRVAVVPLGPGIQLTLLAGRDLLNLNLEAAFAVRGGMSNDDALKTITIDAARVLGIDDRVGSLEVGKDADMIVTDGDLLHYMTMVQHTVVNGRVAYDKSKQTLFSHIRPAGKVENATFDDVWPRKLEWREEPPSPASKPASGPSSGPASAPATSPTSAPASQPARESVEDPATEN